MSKAAEKRQSRTSNCLITKPGFVLLSRAIRKLSMTSSAVKILESFSLRFAHLRLRFLAHESAAKYFQLIDPTRRARSTEIKCIVSRWLLQFRRFFFSASRNWTRDCASERALPACCIIAHKKTVFPTVAWVQFASWCTALRLSVCEARFSQRENFAFCLLTLFSVPQPAASFFGIVFIAPLFVLRKENLMNRPWRNPTRLVQAATKAARFSARYPRWGDSREPHRSFVRNYKI